MRSSFWAVFICVAMVFGPMSTIVLAADDVAVTQEPVILQVGSMAKGLAAVDEQGKKVELGSLLNGKKGIIVFMNTACSACLSEVKLVNELYGRYKDKVELIVIAVDFGDFARIASYRDSNYFEGKWLQDSDFVVPARFGFSFTPAMAILDKDGKVLFLKAGYARPKAKQIREEILTHIK